MAAGGVLLGIAFGTLAQQRDDEGVAQLERVEVTGSRIARAEAESGLPVQVITRDEMLQGGMQTMQDLLERISANQSYGGSNPALGVGSTLTGFTSASLRGLGSQRTLVLLNGRRLAPYALSGGQSVDLSAIPASAIQRVEILKDGASAIYGTDAIGGVMNFILRDDFQGVELNANVLATEQGGGNNGRVSLTAGTGNLATDKFNAFVSADFFRQQPLPAAQRESTKTAYLPDIGLDGTSPSSLPANIFQNDPRTGEVYGFDGRFNPSIPYPGGATADSCLPPYSFPTKAQPTQCGFDFPSVINAIPGYDQVNVIGRVSWQIDADNLFFAEGTYYKGRFTQLVSPTPVQTPMALPADSPYYPAAFVAGLPGGRPDLPLGLAYRLIELGPRTTKTDVDQGNGAFGLKGVVKGWNYQVAANLTTNRQVDNFESGVVYASKFLPLLRSGVVNPFGANTPSVLEQMEATQVVGQANDNRASNYGVALTLSRDVYKAPAGPIAFAAGVEGRRENLQQANSDAVVSGDVLGGAGEIPSLAPVNRNVVSLYGELNVPIASTFEANIAVRYDHYSDFGGTTNPKFTLRWQPSRTLLLRAAYGTGFRAPTLSDLHLPQGLFEGELVDPVRCPVTGDYYDCHYGIPTLEGGNPALKPETSRQLNAGFVFEPVSGLSTSIDYYWVRLQNVITAVPVDVILGADYAMWAPGYVVRDPPDPEHPDLPGPIAHVVAHQTNVGTLTTSGIDANLQWRGAATPVGRFALTLNGTYVLSYSQSGFESASVPPSVGTRGILGAITRYRQYAQLDWTFGGWGATLANNYQDGYAEPCLDSDPSGCTTRHVGSYSVWDVQARYSGFKGTTLTLGIRNLLDRTPPLSNQDTAFQRGFDPSYADPRGRMLYAAVSVAFH